MNPNPDVTIKIQIDAGRAERLRHYAERLKFTDDATNSALEKLVGHCAELGVTIVEEAILRKRLVS